MKKLMLGVLFVGFSFANASMSWTCYRLVSKNQQEDLSKLPQIPNKKPQKKQLKNIKNLYITLME